MLFLILSSAFVIGFSPVAVSGVAPAGVTSAASLVDASSADSIIVAGSLVEVEGSGSVYKCI